LLLKKHFFLQMLKTVVLPNTFVDWKPGFISGLFDEQKVQKIRIYLKYKNFCNHVKSFNQLIASSLVNKIIKFLNNTDPQTFEW